MSASSAASPALSPSVDKALLWASGFAALNNEARLISPDELFIGLLLAHPDAKGEVWCFLAHFGLTGRDLLGDDYRLTDGPALQAAANAAEGADPPTWDADVDQVLADAGAQAAATVHVLDVMLALFTHPTWHERLDQHLNRLGINVVDLWDQLAGFAATLDWRSATPAGQQLSEWLTQHFPREPVTVASFSSDVPNPSEDFIGIADEADAFAYLIASTTLIPPLAIGLFGNWGSGKSFLMASIRERVRQLTTAPDAQGVWKRVVPIEFSAWQYVETDLWAALLARIFTVLSPQQRGKLTAWHMAQMKQKGERDDSVRAQLQAIRRLEDLRQQEADQQRQADAASREVTRVRAELAAMTVAAEQAAQEAHLRTFTADALIEGAGPELAPVAEAIRESLAASAAARSNPWTRQFWTAGYAAMVLIVVVAAPLIGIALSSHNFPAAITIPIAISGATLIAVFKKLTSFIQGQQVAVEKARTKVQQARLRTIQKAEDISTNKTQQVHRTQAEIAEAQETLVEAQQAGAGLDAIAARLTVGSFFNDYLTGRDLSEDYRKRLGVVSTVSHDLQQLSDLIAQYNRAPQEHVADGPPNRIVLYIDDLDRCPPCRVVEVLEAIHLLLGFPLFVVVVAVDTRWLSAALTRALPLLKEDATSDGDAPTAADYLEKIFQIPFWVEPLNREERQRLLHGLLRPSIEEPRVATRETITGNGLKLGDEERQAAERMLTGHGAGLDNKAQTFRITPVELAFIEALTPLLTGTPRQIKRFVNTCKLLLATSPPLAGGEGAASERTAACLLAALNQSMPAFAARLAAAAEAQPDATLEELLDVIKEPVYATDTRTLRHWFASPQAEAQAATFRHVKGRTLIKRWSVLRRLSFRDPIATTHLKDGKELASQHADDGAIAGKQLVGCGELVQSNER